MRQLIIARKDLNMTPGKLAAQCCHASIAFITNELRDQEATKAIFNNDSIDMTDGTDVIGYKAQIMFDKQTYEDWICGRFTKTICGAKNLNQLMKAVDMAKEFCLEEGKDYFVIKDACLTELQPETVDEDGCSYTITCIGFRPLPDDIAHAISMKYQLY